MQTTNLPLQLNTTAKLTGATAAQRGNAANASDAGQFSAMLSNEMALAQAQANMPAPAPAPAPQAASAPKQAAAQPAQASQAAQSDDAPAPQQSTDTTQDSAKAGASDGARQAKADAKPADKTGDEADAAAQKSADPANAMLALIASLQQPAAAKAPVAGAAKGVAQAFDALGGNAGKTRRSETSQLASLQGALKASARDGAEARDLGAAGSRTAVFGDTGNDTGADARAAGANAAADLSAALAGAGMKPDHKATLDAAGLGLQQARDAAQQTAQQLTQQDPSTMAAAALAQASQPAALEAAQAAAGASEQLSAQVGTGDWEDQVGQKVVYMIGNEEQTASLTLNPPDLGPMQVVLSVSNDQASVTFSSNHEEVRQALEDALPRLREMMSESGIALGNASVNAGSQDSRQAQQDASPRGGRQARNAGPDGVAGVDAAAPRVTRTVLRDNGLVDTFA